MRIAVNAVAFYAAWFATVLAASKGWPVAAVAASLTAVALHLALSRRRGIEVVLVLASAVTGLGIETLLLQGGLATYASPGPFAEFAPAWLIALWMAFATLFNVSLVWLKSRLWLAIVLAFIGGPLSYFAGAQLGAMVLAEPVEISLGVIGALWVVAFPLLLVIARLLDPDPVSGSPEKPTSS